MENENHLPFFGIVPYLVIPMLAITGLVIIYPNTPKFNIQQLNNLLIVIGVLFLVLGAVIWLSAMVGSRLNHNIRRNNLITTGIYSHIRHPVYACFLYINIGLVLISTNLILLVLPVIYWMFLSFAIARTEERWLLDLYGDGYERYSRKVNRFFPKLIG